MADKQASRLGLCSRVILYTTPAVVCSLFAITFYQLALHHARLQQLEQKMAYQPQLQDSHHSTGPLRQKAESLLRYVRAVDNAKENESQLLHDYLGKIAELQVD